MKKIIVAPGLKDASVGLVTWWRLSSDL
ncbi:hypothetical protein LCGC14_1282590, partial [marine sediment metagenome]